MRTFVALLSGTAVIVSLTVVPPTVATVPEAVLDTPTVSVDALPTVQIDGIAWAQGTIGNTVYVTGSFANARPAGAAPGTSLTPKQNLLAYDVTTGALNTTFQARLNAQGQVIATSPDGSRVYVGGDFTSANGVARGRLAAFDARTGALITSFAPNLDARVSAITVIGSVVYVGGSFASASGVARTRLAAYRASDGALLSWAPVAGERPVYALAASSDGSTIIVGGKFSSLNGVQALGLGALDPVSGATLPFQANQVIRNSSDVASITSLKVSGSQVYGTGYVYGSGGNLEGAFSADAKSGQITWIEDCHGDTYDSQVLGEAVYLVSHAHYCGNVGGQPQTNPWSFQRAMAWSKAPAGIVLPNHEGGYFNFGGQPAPAPLSFWPILDPGTISGQGQAAWSSTGNSSYVAFAGEFPRVNNKPQQGLVRFAVRSIAPNLIGPEGSSGLTPKFAARTASSLRVAWVSAWDRDDNGLTYRVTRNGVTVHEAVVRSRFWDRPAQSFVDTGLTPGATYVYRVFATDSRGRMTSSPSTSFTLPTSVPTPPAYVDVVRSDGATSLWRFDEASGLTVFDRAGGSDLTLTAAVTRNVAGPIQGDVAASFANSVQAVSPAYVDAPAAFSIEAWIRTTTKTGGKIVGFGNELSKLSSVRDRQLYMANDGKVHFGLLPRTGAMSISSPASLNDGKWHHVLGTLNGLDGMALYVDGKRLASNTSVTFTKPYSGYWHVGGDSIGSYPSRPTSDYFNGSIDEVAIYPRALTGAEVADHFAVAAGGQPTNQPPVGKFTTSVVGPTVSVDASGSTDPDGSIATYSWTFGDGAVGSGKAASHTYEAGGTYQVVLKVTDNDGAIGTTSTSVVVAAPPPNQAPTAAFTAVVSGLTVSLDASGSSDSDGSIIGYAWDLGDGTQASGVTASHSYGAGGSYAIRLVVTDDKGATGTLTKSITATAPTSLVSDSFTRSVAVGWGSAPVGGSWTSSPADSSTWVGSGVGNMRLDSPGAMRRAWLGQWSVTATDVTVRVSADKIGSGSGTYTYVVGRRIAANREVRARVRYASGARVGVALSSLQGTSSEVVLASEILLPGTIAAGTDLKVRTRTVGVSPTTVGVKVWFADQPEPADWLLSATTNVAALQAPGGVGLTTYLGGSATNAPVTIRWDDLLVVVPEP